MTTQTLDAPVPASLHPASNFDPSRYLSKLSRRARTPEGGWRTVEQDYLEVKWRLLWLRSEVPDARIETELVKHEEGLAIFRAHVTLPNGAESSGWGSETADDWKDFIEKAETKALGRALAALGFGTQFCEDYDFAGGREDKVVDAPVAPPRASSAEITRIPVESRRGPEPPRPAARDTGAVSAASRATEPQVKAIYAIARSAQSMDEAQTAEWCRARYGVPPAELTRRQASELIDALKLGQAS